MCCAATLTLIITSGLSFLSSVGSYAPATDLNQSHFGEAARMLRDLESDADGLPVGWAKSDLYGSSDGGTHFDDYAAAHLYGIQQIDTTTHMANGHVGSYNVISSIAIKYERPKEASRITHGDPHGYVPQHFVLDYRAITQVTVFCGTWIDAIEFETSNGDRVLRGGSGGRDGKHSVPAPPGTVLKAFFGSAGAYIDRIGFIFGPPASADGALLSCGSSADPIQNEKEVGDAFALIRDVCKQQNESFTPPSPLPTTCQSAQCQRAVQLVEDSCGPVFVKDEWLKTAFKPTLDAAVAVCASSTPSASTQRHIITGHPLASRALVLQARDGGWLTDGMGTYGHNASINGQDYAVVQAAAGQMAQLDLRALWLSQGNNVRVSIDGGAATVLQGTMLPEGGRTEVLFKARGGNSSVASDRQTSEPVVRCLCGQ